MAAAVQRSWRGKKCNHIVWLTLAVPRRFAGLGCRGAATFGLAPWADDEKGIVGIGPSVEAALRASYAI